MLRTGGVCRNKGQVDFRRLGGGELNLGLFRSLAQALQRHLVVAQINALFLLEFVGKVIDELQVEVLTAEESIAVGGADFKDAVANLENGHVERTAAKVVDSNRLVR